MQSRPTIVQSFPKEYGVLSCVYRLSFNDKYVIVKAKDHVSSVSAIQKSYNQFMRHSEFQRDPKNLYFQFFSFIEKHRVGTFAVHIILEDSNPYKLLVAEQKELLKSRKDTRCLNTNADAYIPDYNELTESYGWIPKQSVMNFMKWLKKNAKAKKSQ